MSYIAHTSAVPFWYNPPTTVYEGESWTDALEAVAVSLESMPQGGMGGIARVEEPHIAIATFDRDPRRNGGVPTKRDGLIDIPMRSYITR